MKPLVAICSQDPEFYILLGHILEVDGFSATLAGSVQEMFELAKEKPVQAIVLDCRPKNQTATEIVKLKQEALASTLTCVALISPGAEHCHIKLLKSGLEEVFVRPFAPSRLLDFLRSRLIPSDQPANFASPDAKLLKFGDIHMQLEAYRVHCNGTELPLGPIEFKLLRHMLEYPQKVISREELIEAAWSGRSDVSARTVDVHISQLRKLLKRCSQVSAIRTVRSAGYALEQTKA